MTSSSQPKRTHPAAWVPTLYFAEGIPLYVVTLLALTFYQRMGVSNAKIAFATSLLGLPWTLKPLWSPLLEMYKTKKFFVVLMQLAGGFTLLLLAFSLPMPSYFRISIGLFGVIAFCSATHDIAADGVYIASLTAKEQAAFAGLQGACYNAARFFSLGVLIYTAGVLTDRFTRTGTSAPIVHAWLIIFAAVGGILLLLSAYHWLMLPTGGEERNDAAILHVLEEKRTTPEMGRLRRRCVEWYEEKMAGWLANLPEGEHSGRQLRLRALAFLDVLFTFFMKQNIWVFMIFILLYRAGEGQVVKIGPLFLQAPRESGGLGLSLQQFGTIYGFFGTGSFIAGSILAGIFTSKLGLKRAILWLLLILNLPMAAYLYLSIALPTNPIIITVAMSIEMFGYGFGFVGVILLMMQEIAPGRYQMAHYAFANSIMNLGLIVAGMPSGKIQEMIGYKAFFAMVLVSAIPALIMAKFIPLHAGDKQEPEQAAAGA